MNRAQGTGSKLSRKGLFCCLALAGSVAITGSPAVAKKKPDPVIQYGPAPQWERFKELGEEAIRAMLVDPESARFTWSHGYRQDGFTPSMSRRRHGYTTCGHVNARNRMGGYNGRTTFTVVIDHDRVIHAEIGKPGGADLLSAACDKALQQQKFPPLSAITEAGTFETGPGTSDR